MPISYICNPALSIVQTLTVSFRLRGAVMTCSISFRNLLLFLLIPVAIFADSDLLYPRFFDDPAATVEVLFLRLHPNSGTTLLSADTMENGYRCGLERVFLMHRNQRLDITHYGKEATFSVAGKNQPGFRIPLSRKSGFLAAGDYSLFTVPYPSWSPVEKRYYQNITKILLNRGGFMTGWHKRQLSTMPEIVPLNSPFTLQAGAIFRFTVLGSSGKPIPGAIVHINYFNRKINTEEGIVSVRTHVSPFTSASTTIISDLNGIGAFTPTREGLWEICAEGIGTIEEYRGQPLTQSAALWLVVAAN